MDSYSKCKRFLAMVAKRTGSELIESKSTKSVYLKVRNRTIRLSDHTTENQNNASGYISIIVPDNNTDMFVLIMNGMSSVSVVDYKRVKELVNTFSEFPHAFGHKVMNEYTVERVVQPIGDNKNETIFGVAKNLFNENQLRIFRQTAKKVATENNLSVPNL
jgi:hypothetical protein